MGECVVGTRVTVRDYATVYEGPMIVTLRDGGCDNVCDIMRQHPHNGGEPVTVRMELA